MGEAGVLDKRVPLETLGKLVPIIAILLPVAGVAFRAISFMASSTPVPAEVAAAQPVGALALTGFFVVARGAILALLPLPLIWLLFRFGILPSGEPERGMSVAVVGIVGVGISVSTFTNLTGATDLVRSLAAALVTLALVLTFLWAGGRPRLFALLAVAVAVVGVNVLAAGLLPNTAGTFLADLRFAQDAVLADGTYAVLGQEASKTWLLNCAPAAQPVQVPSDSIVSMQVARFGLPASPESLGFDPHCPQ